MGCPEGTPDSSVPELARAQKVVHVAGRAGGAQARPGMRRAHGLGRRPWRRAAPCWGGEGVGPREPVRARAPGRHLPGGPGWRPSPVPERGGEAGDAAESWPPTQAVLNLSFLDCVRKPGFSIFKGHETEDKVNPSRTLGSVLVVRGKFSLPAAESLADLPCRLQLAARADRSELPPTSPVQSDLQGAQVGGGVTALRVGPPPGPGV